MNWKSCALRVAAAMVGMHASMLCWADSTTHANDFDSLYTHLNAWATGTLGKSIALVFLLVGLAVGVLRGSIVGAISCLAAALSLVIAPSVINTIFAG